MGTKGIFILSNWTGICYKFGWNLLNKDHQKGKNQQKKGSDKSNVGLVGYHTLAHAQTVKHPDSQCAVLPWPLALDPCSLVSRWCEAPHNDCYLSVQALLWMYEGLVSRKTFDSTVNTCIKQNALVHLNDQNNLFVGV